MKAFARRLYPLLYLNIRGTYEDAIEAHKNAIKQLEPFIEEAKERIPKLTQRA